MKEVLYVPSIHYNLFAQNIIKSRVIMVASDNYVHIFNKNDPINTMFVTNIDNEIARVHENAYKTTIPPMIVETAHLAHKVALPPMIA